jgi:hypothetical protein
MTQEQQQEQAKNVVETLYSNLIESLETTRQITKQHGDETFQTKVGNISFNDIFNFDKIDIVSYIGYLFMTKQNNTYFGNTDHETVQFVFTEIYSKKVMNSLVKKYLH